MGRRDPLVFDEALDESDGAGLGMGATAGDVLVFDAERNSWRPGPEPYTITTPSGEYVTFSSIEVAREVRYVLNGLTLEGKL